MAVKKVTNKHVITQSANEKQDYKTTSEKSRPCSGGRSTPRCTIKKNTRMEDKFLILTLVLFSPVSNLAEVVPLIVSQWKIGKIRRGEKNCCGDAIRQDPTQI
jgi:hypothetical protein